MLWQIIDLSEEAASLSVRYDQLIIKRGEKIDSVPLEELAVLIVGNPQVRYTNAVLNGICANGGSFIVCDEKHMPAGQILPLAGNFIQTRRFTAQINASLILKKRIWAQIVKAKIKAQGKLLERLRDSDFGLSNMTKKVRSGDPDNIEAQASRRYWLALFGPSFRRIPMGRDNINSMLNYGYAILRSLVTRGLCASGLHPSIGIHHHNQYDPFCLANDIMEPLRPLIDEAVFETINFLGNDYPLDKTSKGVMLNNIYSRKLRINKESRSIFDAVLKISSSLTDIFLTKRKKLILPEP